MIERTLSWLRQYKKLSIRRERSVTTYQTLTDLAFCLIYLKQLPR